MLILRPVLAPFFIMIGTAALGDELSIPLTEEERAREILALNWQFEPGNYGLDLSRSSIGLPGDLSVVFAEDARRVVLLGEGTEFPGIEAVVVDTESMSQVYFQYFDSGYVPTDDWEELDAAEMLESIRDSTREANETKRGQGFPELTVLGWVQEPTLDTTTMTAHWAIDALADDLPIVNAIALKLGRRGFEKLTWIGERDVYLGETASREKPGLLLLMIQGHEYDEGVRYADFSEEDALAGFGIASLVAITAGATSSRGKGFLAGALAVVLVFLKKAWVLALVALGGIGAVVTRVFRRRRSVAPPPERHT